MWSGAVRFGAELRFGAEVRPGFEFFSKFWSCVTGRKGGAAVDPTLLGRTREALQAEAHFWPEIRPGKWDIF